MKLQTIFIQGRPRPWTAPRRGRKGMFSPTRYTEYLDRINIEATLAFNLQEMPYKGPISLKMDFAFLTKDKTKIGKPHTQVPDLTNLIKAIEDAIKETAFGDDCAVCSITATKCWTGLRELEGVQITVIGGK